MCDNDRMYTKHYNHCQLILFQFPYLPPLFWGEYHILYILAPLVIFDCYLFHRYYILHLLYNHLDMRPNYALLRNLQLYMPYLEL